MNILAKMLDEATFFLVDSYAIEEFLHENGVNMRMMGLMAQKVSLNFNRKVFETEMIARSLYRIFYTNV